MSLVNLSNNNIQKIQIDEGIVVINLGEEDQIILGPTRGGVEFTATPSIRDIEFDGRKGKSKGLQVKDGEDVTLKVACLCCSLENLKLAIPGATIASDKITPGNFGVISTEAYLKSVAAVTKMIDGTYTIIKVANPMHEGAFTYKGSSKSENEHNLEFVGHYNPTDNVESCIWEVITSSTNPLSVH